MERKKDSPEELLKIINSGHSFEIVSGALDTDLYTYLQPAATSMMLEDKDFEKAYMQSLKDMDSFTKTHPEARLGDKLCFILRDFIKDLTDWSKENKGSSQAAELYKRTWARCRNFVLPMNPQRTELEFAVRKVLSQYGVQVKIPRKRTRVVLAPED